MKPLINKLFNIRFPIISGGMVWVSGGKLAAAVSEAGGLGLIGAGSMKPDLLTLHIKKAQSLTQKQIGVNVPLLYEGADKQIQTALDLGVRIFFTSAGSPKKLTSFLKKEGALVVHVTSSPELAQKCEDAGVDAIVAEGFEAGGHNGREEITTMTLIPQVVAKVKIPVIAAGGIATGGAIAAALSLGASGVQMGTRFLLSHESSAHSDFKNKCLNALPDSTQLLMKATVPVRLLENRFADEIRAIEQQYIGEDQKARITKHLGKMRAKTGMLDGDIVDGELEVGQIVSHIKEIKSVADIMGSLINEYNETLQNLSKLN